MVSCNFIPLYTQMDAVYIFYIPTELAWQHGLQLENFQWQNTLIFAYLRRATFNRTVGCCNPHGVWGQRTGVCQTQPALILVTWTLLTLISLILSRGVVEAPHLPAEMLNLFKVDKE